MVFRWRRVSASSKMSSWISDAVWMISIATASSSTGSLAKASPAASSVSLVRGVDKGHRSMRCTKWHRAGRRRLPPALNTSRMACWSFRLSAELPNASKRRWTSSWSPATHRKRLSKSRSSGSGARRSSPPQMSQSTCTSLFSKPKPTIAGRSRATTGTPAATSLMPSSRSRDSRSALCILWSCALSRKFAIFKSNLSFRRSTSLGAASGERCSSSCQVAAASGSSARGRGRQPMPEMSVMSASFSLLSWRQSKRAAAR
mmetsp:Transcript_66733/g.204157  ORF Transcript_66733/g.204157 Transcript_66733/m.204157 type:complete len:259 (-) Transcript_66733:1136-1912(-)